MIGRVWNWVVQWLRSHESREHRIAREMRDRMLYPPRRGYEANWIEEGWRR